MSADLFAAFETSASSQSPNGPPKSIPAAVSGSDPFSFLISDVSAPQQRYQHGAQQWQSPAQQQTVNPWAATQVGQSQVADIWGDFGGLGAQGISSLTGTKPIEAEEDDAWGDFEVAAAEPPQPPVAGKKVDPPRNRIMRAPTMDLMTNKLVDLDLTSSTLESWQERPSWETPAPQKSLQNPDPNVIFDADDFGAEESVVDADADFGDFEAVPAARAAPKGTAFKSALDLLSLDSSVGQTKKQPPGLLLSSLPQPSNSVSYPEAPKSPYGSFQKRKPEAIKQLRVKTPQPSEFPKDVRPASPIPVTAWPSVGEGIFDNEWAEFEDFPSEANPHPTDSATKPALGLEISEREQPNAAGETSSLEVNRPPPTNVPPPAILLSIFPQILDLANTSLLTPIRPLPASSKDLVVTHTATITFLRGYLALATVAARIVAGRKLRWHRDKFLMQGMAISAAGGKGGMKLAGVDKTQSARDDREAAEVVDIWKRQVGRLRSAVAAANAAVTDGGQPLKVPELNLTLACQSATMVPTAPKPCIICGIKRDERISKVDFDVEDSFGEWWVEFWGHRACRSFWLEHEAKLRQR
ncbi:hypothetical protein B0H63DRAFT_482106 [Podospora didyma]|uniref:Serine/threonine-protein kinase ppk6 n=1 Tax=Podospora didyma TaxID=330526 RepID=A0AAE0KET3_9PEZI|nr:hypothetical protein B0H63DRAFT_482106 [Podospora didyma]